MKIGIDIGGSHIGIGVVDKNGKIIEKREKDLDIKLQPNENKVNVLDKSKVKKDIKSYLLENTKEFIQKYEIEIIGVASPGNSKDGKIMSLVNLGIEELNMMKIFKEICDIPIIIRNDAKCAAIAEKKYGSLKKYTDSVFLCLGTGIGGAVFINNTLLTPKRNSGFELGHMIIEKNGKLCNCGKKGCFETYCSMKRLKNRLIDIMELPPKTDALTLKKVLEERINEEKVKNEIDIYLDDLIIGISNIIDIFESEAICLGGSFVYFKDILFDKLLEKYNKQYVFNKQELPELKLASLGNDAGIIGAGEI